MKGKKTSYSLSIGLLLLLASAVIGDVKPHSGCQSGCQCDHEINFQTLDLEWAWADSCGYLVCPSGCCSSHPHDCGSEGRSCWCDGPPRNNKYCPCDTKFTLTCVEQDYWDGPCMGDSRSSCPCGGTGCPCPSEQMCSNADWGNCGTGPWACSCDEDCDCGNNLCTDYNCCSGAQSCSCGGPGCYVGYPNCANDYCQEFGSCPTDGGYCELDK